DRDGGGRRDRSRAVVGGGERDQLERGGPKDAIERPILRHDGLIQGHQTFESGNEALRRSIHSRSSRSTASSIGGGSYSASVRFHAAFARCAMSCEPSISHCSRLLLSASGER